MENVEYKGYNINIKYDEALESPREWGNLGKMVCWHKRYTLGDEKLQEDYVYSKECSVKNLTEYCDNWEEVENVLIKEFKAFIILPLFLYDHSGLSLKTFPHGYHGSWDCGQVGFIFVTKDDVRKEFNVKKISKKVKEKAEKILISEVETYSQYINGEVYYFSIENEEGEQIDSCGGWYNIEEAITEAKSIVDFDIKEHEKNLQETKALVLG